MNDKELSNKIKKMQEQNSPEKRKEQVKKSRQFALNKFNNRKKEGDK